MRASGICMRVSPGREDILLYVLYVQYVELIRGPGQTLSHVDRGRTTGTCLSSRRYLESTNKAGPLHILQTSDHAPSKPVLDSEISYLVLEPSFSSCQIPASYFLFGDLLFLLLDVPWTKALHRSSSYLHCFSSSPFRGTLSL